MKKRSIGLIGIACLIAGIGLAGCGAGSSQMEETTTAETTTVEETTSSETTTAETSIAEETTSAETTTAVEMTHLIPTDVKVGDVITFGNYPQETDGTVKPIEWQVLDVKDDKAFIISKYCLDNKLYSEEHEGVTWETCSLRTWLNNDFYNMAFSADEQKIIENTEVINDDNPIWGTDGGNDTVDKVFLLSLDETLNYFNMTKDENNESHAERMVYCYGDESSSKPTEYAVSQGLYEYDDGYCIWWLRTVGGLSGNGATEGGGIVIGGSENGGYIGTYGRDENGVRPALWVNLATTGEMAATSEALTAVASAHSEDDQIMENLRNFYRSHEKVDGVPYRDNYKYLRFAIADFDSDGEDEVMIEDYYDINGYTGYYTMSMYDHESPIGEGYSDKIIPYQYFSDAIFLDNGVAYVTREDWSIDNKVYYLLSEDMPQKFNYDMSLMYESPSRRLVYRENSNGTIERSLESVHEGLFDPVEVTQTEYEQEKQMLESGNVMNIEIKDFTAENIGL